MGPIYVLQLFKVKNCKIANNFPPTKVRKNQFAIGILVIQELLDTIYTQFKNNPVLSKKIAIVFKLSICLTPTFNNIFSMGPIYIICMLNFFRLRTTSSLQNTVFSTPQFQVFTFLHFASAPVTMSEPIIIRDMGQSKPLKDVWVSYSRCKLKSNLIRGWIAWQLCHPGQANSIAIPPD